MELTVAIAISIVNIVITVTNFALSRKDRANKIASDTQKQFDKHILIEYRLDELKEKVDKILNKLDSYDKEVDDKVKKAIDDHIKCYHKEVSK